MTQSACLPAQSGSGGPYLSKSPKVPVTLAEVSEYHLKMPGLKVYATPEQKMVLMEVYEAENYPEQATLVEVST